MIPFYLVSRKQIDNPSLYQCTCILWTRYDERSDESPKDWFVSCSCIWVQIWGEGKGTLIIQFYSCQHEKGWYDVIFKKLSKILFKLIVLRLIVFPTCNEQSTCNIVLPTGLYFIKVIWNNIRIENRFVFS